MQKKYKKVFKVAYRFLAFPEIPEILDTQAIKNHNLQHNRKIKMPRNVVFRLNREIKMPQNSKIVPKNREIKMPQKFLALKYSTLLSKSF